MDNNTLTHHGVLGMKWGVRRYQNKDGTLTAQGQKRYDRDVIENNKQIKTNTDGSKVIPKGFSFNRVGKTTMDVNQSGGLYVSYGKDDAARYIKALGPTPIAKLLGTAGEAIQHIRVKQPLKMPSDEQTAVETARLLLANPKLLNFFNESFYSIVATGDLEKNISHEDLESIIKNPSGKESQKLSYSLSSFLGDGNYTNESKMVYEHFRKCGYDAIPDIHDRLSGTSKTALIVINPSKVEITSTTIITNDVMKLARTYVKTIEKLKVNDLIK